MKLKFNWIFTLLLAFFIQFSFAQEKTITGVVTSQEDGLSIPGVNVIVQGTTRGTQTDFDGKYSIKAAPGEKLVISLLGTKSKTIPVGTSNVINVVLQSDDAVELNTVNVEGYNRAIAKSESNVVSTTIGAKTITARPNASLAQTMQGQIAGVNVSTASGQPGASSNVVIRGYSSLSGKSEPLYVIDGVPLNNDAFKSLNPNEIETMTALVDAGATSIYGNRGANGVIVITTKKGSYDSSMNFKYIGTTAFNTLQQSGYEMMNSQQLLTLQREYGRGPGSDNFVAGGEPMTDEQINSYGTTDWEDYFFRTGITTTHDLSISSGSKNLRSLTSIGYRNEEGILQNSDLQRFNLRNNTDGKSNNGKFTYNLNLSLNFSIQNSVFGQDLAQGNIYYDPLVSANLGAPYLTPEGYPGSAGLVDLVNSYPTNVFIPYQAMDIQPNSISNTENFKMVDNFSAGYQFDENWKIYTSVGIDYSQATSLAYLSPNAYVSLLQTYFSGGREQFGFQRQSNSRVGTINYIANLNYNKQIGKSTFDATAYFEYYYANFISNQYSKSGLDAKQSAPGTSNGFLTSTSINSYIPSIGASAPSTSLLSYFATLDYDYDKKLGFGGSIRRDASSKFTETNKWGTFYSLSGRWNIDRMSFMENSAFQMLKLRASYGTTGNQDITGSTFGGLNLDQELYASSSGYNDTNSYVLAQLSNPDLIWETVAQANVGIDFVVFNNNFTGRLDFYNKKTTDLFQPIVISAVNATTTLSANFGALENSGVELQMSYNVIRSDSGFNLKLNFNGAYNQSNMIDVPNAEGFQDNGTTVRSEGHPIDEFYLVPYIGVNPANGNLLFLDKNGNATENPDNDSDRVYTGKVSDPKYTGGFGLDADYKGFYCTLFFTYAADFYRFDYDLQNAQDIQNISQFNLSSDLLRSWTPDNRITDMPSIFYTNAAAVGSSDRYLVDASYLRIRNLKVGYSVPSDLLKRTPFTQFNLFLQAENMVTWSKWQGRDAENATNTASTFVQYPTPKIVSFGLQLDF